MPRRDEKDRVRPSITVPDALLIRDCIRLLLRHQEYSRLLDVDMRLAFNDLANKLEVLLISWETRNRIREEREIYTERLRKQVMDHFEDWQPLGPPGSSIS